MLDQLEAFARVAAAKNMAEAGIRLHISQSAVSKRVAALEERLRLTLLERRGRRCVPSAAGKRLLARVGPLLAELAAALIEEQPASDLRVVLGVSESILASWGPGLLASALGLVPGIELVLHGDRSPLVVERVRAGEYQLGLVAGIGRSLPDLRSLPIVSEPMVLVPSGLKDFRWPSDGKLPVLTIEPSAATWKAIRRQPHIRRLEPGAGLESFGSVVQLAAAGFGHGLVPVGIAHALGIQDRALRRLPAPGVARPVVLVGRKSILAQPRVSAFVTALAAAAQGLVPGWNQSRQ